MPPVGNVPLAPVAGAVNVTSAPVTGLLLLSVTRAARLVVKGCPSGALWLFPAETAIAAAAACTKTCELVVEIPVVVSVTVIVCSPGVLNVAWNWWELLSAVVNV